MPDLTRAEVERIKTCLAVMVTCDMAYREIDRVLDS